MHEMTSTGSDTVIGNAVIVLADRVIEHGWVAIADGRIAEIGEGKAPAGSEDARGDLLMPGLIELHTDHLEAHYVPRPKVYWDPIAAVVSYDGQLVTCGITTVLDSLRVWREDGAEDVDGRAGVLAGAITAVREGVRTALNGAAEDAAARDLLFLDLALEETFRGAVERQNLSQLDRDRLVDLKKDSRLVHGMLFKNVGAAANYNLLVAMTDTPYFKWAAHDDVLAPGFLAACIDALDRDPTVVLASPATTLID